MCIVLPLPQRLCRFTRSLRHRERPAKITAGARRHYAELDISPALQYSVSDLVYRAVAAACNYKCPARFAGAAANDIPSPADFVNATLKGAEVRPQIACDPGPIFPGRTSGRSRVDDDER